MPTENRSSNTEQMVSVPREWVENYAGLLEERCACEASERVQAFLAQPAAQHQGELERLRAALKFYADREHYHFESGNWDTVSGEPLNILWCGDDPDFIEDGSVARAALERKS
ncbi:hypothetical protein [Pseudomonas palmensis]|uniref:hypothetical protein n=1 Tax=Pseudomonas palmensis TaxID=2815362 RepID=UPI003CF12793